MTKKEIGKIEKGLPQPKRGRSSRWKFAEMAPGDSFYFEGIAPQQVVGAFGNYLSRGKYRLVKEGKGYRFFLKKGEGEDA